MTVIYYDGFIEYDQQLQGAAVQWFLWQLAAVQLVQQCSGFYISVQLAMVYICDQALLLW